MGAIGDEDEGQGVDGEVADGDEQGFGGWDEDEDAKYIERNLKKQMRKKGIDPRASKSKAVQSLAPQKVTEGEASKKADKPEKRGKKMG